MMDYQEFLESKKIIYKSTGLDISRDKLSPFLNQIICGDCLESMKDIPDMSVDLVLTDPPYGIDFQSAWRIDKTQWKPKIANDKEPFVDWIPNAFRITKDNGCLLCFCRWDVQERFKQAIEKAGFEIKSQIIWDKVIHGMGDLKASFAPQHEVIWFATKGDFIFPNMRPSTILRFKRVDAEKLIHPNEKPIELIEYLISVTTKPNDVVADFFMGSGVTAEASCILDRNFIGTELEGKYCDIARQRLEQAQAQGTLFGGDAPC